MTKRECVRETRYVGYCMTELEHDKCRDKEDEREMRMCPRVKECKHL